MEPHSIVPERTVRRCPKNDGAAMCVVFPLLWCCGNAESSLVDFRKNTYEKSPQLENRTALTVMVWPKKIYYEIFCTHGNLNQGGYGNRCNGFHGLRDRRPQSDGSGLSGVRGPHHLLHRHDGDGAGNGDPTVSALQKCFPRIPGGGDFGIQPASRKIHLWRKYFAM